MSVNAPDASPSSIISAYSRAANFHNQHLLQRADAINAQISCLLVASLNLDSHVLNLSSAYDAFSVTAQRELEKQEEILKSHERDMQVISQIRVHSEFITKPNNRRALDAAARDRMLVAYVHAPKMHQVAANCANLHGAFWCESVKI